MKLMEKQTANSVLKDVKDVNKIKEIVQNAMNLLILLQIVNKKEQVNFMKLKLKHK